MTDLHPDVERWLVYLAQRNRSPATLRSYRSTMRGYLPDPLAATLLDAESWWDDQDALSVNSRNRALSCVRSFYKWASRFDLRADDPTRRLDPPHKGSRLPRPIGRADLTKILDQCDREEAPDIRRAICLGAYAGVRVAEAAVLNWRDVDLESRRLIVRGGKGDKDRAVGLPALLLDELLPDTGGNVVTGRTEAYSADALQRRVNRLIERAGVDATFHKLRARFATLALSGTGNLLAVSRALGHSSTTTTAIYAATSDADLDLIAAAVTR
jgi:site-specific recombinase XerD